MPKSMPTIRAGGDGKNVATSPGVLINPSSGLLGQRNAILTGTSNVYYVPDFEGCLSIKAVVAGNAAWEAGGRHFVVRENCFLILNDRQRYTITIDSGARKTTTFCLFFARGFVEDVWRTSVTPVQRLLDQPNVAKVDSTLGFFERLENDAGILDRLRSLRAQALRSSSGESLSDELFYDVAAELVHAQKAALAAIVRLPALRSSTRVELCRRLLRARDFLLSAWDQPLQLEEVAREACLSPYHFHRAFSRYFGCTPHTLLNQYRVERVAEQLRKTERSITELCFAHGFGSMAAFCSLFRRHFGVSAREYRRAFVKRAAG